MPVWDERHYPDRLLGNHDVTFIFGEDVTLPDRVAELPPQPDQGPAFALHVEAEELCQRAREIARQMQNRDDIADGEELRHRIIRLRAAGVRVLREAEGLIEEAHQANFDRVSVLLRRQNNLSSIDKAKATKDERGGSKGGRTKSSEYGKSALRADNKLKA